MKGRPLKPRQAGLIDTLLPHLAIDIPDEGEIDLAFPSPLAEGERLGAGAVLVPPADDALAAPSRIILEIGFGGGEHLVAQASRAPDALFLGAEPFLNGVGSCLRHVEESGAGNVRLHHGDARDLIDKLPPASLDLIYILFPDPWPKTRHWKRRLIQPAFIAALARVLKPGGEVRFATDWKAYAAWTLEAYLRAPAFTWTAERADDWRQAWADHARTRYEEKALGDTAPIFLRFQRVARAT